MLIIRQYHPSDSAIAGNNSSFWVIESLLRSASMPELFPRTVKTSSGVWLSRKTAKRLVDRGRARWDGKTLELIPTLEPAAFDRALAAVPRPRVRHSFLEFSKLLHHANCQDPHWIDLRPAMPISPAWLERMGY